MYIQNRITSFFLFFILYLIFTASCFAQEGVLRLAWTPNTEPYLSHYMIYRDTISGTMVPLDIIAKSESTYQDRTIEAGITYYYKLTAADSFGNESLPSNEVSAKVEIITSFPEKDAEIISAYELKQNYPNPFNGTTRISYTLADQSWVSLVIYDALGREIKRLVEAYKGAGSYSVDWDGKNEQGNVVASGVYYYQIMTEKFTNTKKLISQK